MISRYLSASMASFVAIPLAQAEIVHYVDLTEWQSTVEEHSIIEFNGFAHGTAITNQYANWEVTFTNTVFIQEGEFWSDGVGLFGNDGIHFQFDTPQNAIAVDYLGAIAFALYNDDDLVATSFLFFDSAGPFAGVVSDLPFDEVRLFKPWPPFDNNIISIDTLYWGMPIPAPGALPLFAAALLTTRRRRR